MNEGEHNRRLVKSLRKNLTSAVVFKHADTITAGVPDISVNWRRKTIWLEGKVLRSGKTFKSRGIQDLMMQRLAAVSIAYYVVYDERLDAIWIGEPLIGNTSLNLPTEISRTPGIIYDHVSDFLRLTHA